MRTLISAAVILMSVSVLSAYHIIYDRETKRVYHGYQDVSRERSNPDRYAVKSINENDALLKNDLENLTYVENSGTFVKKSNEEIENQTKDKRKKEIRAEVRKLKQQYLEAMSERAEGFNVSQETTTIRATLEDLKVEWQSLNQ